MTWWVLITTSLVGGLGAATRLWTDWLLTTWTRLPHLGIAVVNMLGSAVLGATTGLLSVMESADSATLTIVGTGFCGGYTTFSTAILGAISQYRTGRRWAALGLAIGTAAACYCAAFLGFHLAQRH